MVDSTHLPDSPTDGACPWCSAAITPETATCPSCNAILIADEEHDLPGLTAVDQSIVRPEKKPQQSRGRFLSWFGSEQAETQKSEADAQAIAPPDDAVQREILRLELEAHISNLQAEADSILSDALVEGRVDDLPEDLRPLVAAEAGAETPQETADAMVEAAMTPDAEGSETPVAEGSETDGADEADQADDVTGADEADKAT